MATVKVVVKHQGKKHDVEVDPASTGEDFKLQLFSLTSVEPARQKILIKGSQLKDDADMGKMGLKAGQVIMMMGTSSSGEGNLVRPKDPIKFVEDMTEAEKAQQMDATPAGLVNLGNTCYLNSTLQALRSLPEMNKALISYNDDASENTGVTADLSLASHLSRLYARMDRTQEALPPVGFLKALRSAFPQFAERSKSDNGFAQQDAEEAWSQIVQNMRPALKAKNSAGTSSVPLIDTYMSGQLTSKIECQDAEAVQAGEQPAVQKEDFLKLSCHIDGTTNHLRDGILAALSETIEKKSAVLDRQAEYKKTSAISRAPKYLTVHFVRFFWKRQTQKKAKIMRKVTFPQELDIVEFCSDELKKALIPVRDKVREIRKDEEDIERARKRRKKNHEQDLGDIPGGSGLAPSKKDGKKDDKTDKAKEADEAAAGETFKTDAEIDAEKDAAVLAAKKELHAMIDPSLRDEGANQSGLYELRCVVTHQGGSADSGHYTAYVKKPAAVDPKTGKRGEEDGMWWWFNDEKVTEVTVDKIEGLAGGGESHSALILLYAAIPLPTADGTME
ncbi:hypothetical protein CP532_6462 [Ophiocordyceps camponoti-leonardi (nom. inval.)]|nr:hypothetical protein CP532_6462 [Ophiocordyceps camponoti-leonardi (nom. inval.)]